MKEMLVIGVLVLIGYLIYKVYKLKEDYNSLQNNYKHTKTLCESQQKELFELKNKYSYLEKLEQELSTANEQVEKLEQYKIALIDRMGMYISHKCEGYHHLAGLMADMSTRHFDKTAKFLKTKNIPPSKRQKVL